MLILHLSIVLLLIIVNSVFAMAEIALVSARKARLVPVAEAGNRGAQAAPELKADPSRLLSTVQLGVTPIAVLSGSFGEATLGDQLKRQLGSRARDRRGDHRYAARGGCDRTHPARRDRDRRDGAACRRSAGERCHDAADANRMGGSRRFGGREPAQDP